MGKKMQQLNSCDHFLLPLLLAAAATITTTYNNKNTKASSCDHLTPTTLPNLQRPLHVLKQHSKFCINKEQRIKGLPPVPLSHIRDTHLANHTTDNTR